jgi:U4/U6.U5 tri-snRNP-associated protein 1
MHIFFLNQTIFYRTKEGIWKDIKEGGILDGNDGASEILSWVGKSCKLDEKSKLKRRKHYVLHEN